MNFTFDPVLSTTTIGSSTYSNIGAWVARIIEVPLYVLQDGTPDRVFWTDAAATGFRVPLSLGQKFVTSYSYVEIIGTAQYIDGATIRPVAVTLTPNEVPGVLVLSEFKLANVTVTGDDLGKIFGPLVVSYTIPDSVIYDVSLKLPLNKTDLADVFAKQKLPYSTYIGEVNPLLVISRLHRAINNIEANLGIAPTPWSGGIVAEQVSFDPTLYPGISHITNAHINEISDAVRHLGDVCNGIGYAITIEAYDQWREYDILPLFGSLNRPGLADLINDVNTIERQLSAIVP